MRRSVIQHIDENGCETVIERLMQMTHQEQLTNILSFLDDVEDDVLSVNGEHFKEEHSTSTPTSKTKRFIWDDWGEETSDPKFDSNSIPYESIEHDEESSVNSPVSTISQEPSRKSPHCFISPTHHARQTSTSSSITANAFRDVQAKIHAMQIELDERSEEVFSKEKELRNVRLGAESSLSALVNSWRDKSEDAHISAQVALEKQKDFQRRLAIDVDKLKNKQETVSEQISRLIRRRDGEISGAKREVVAKLRAERENWVSSERGKLAKLAQSKAESMKTVAVESLEPVLTDLIRKQRVELRDLEIKLKENFSMTIRQHRIKLQKDKDEVHKVTEGRYSAAMSRQRDEWSDEFKEVMSRCEVDALALRREHDQAMTSDRVSHDHMWRQLMANKEAEVEAIRTEAAGKASKLVQHHNQATLILSEKHASAAKVAEQTRGLQEESAKKRVCGEIVEDRANLDSKAIAEVRAKANKELDMVRDRLQRQFAEEMVQLEGALTEGKVKLAHELAGRLVNMKELNHPISDDSDSTLRSDDEEERRMIELKLSIERDTAQVMKLDHDIRQCLKTIQDEKNRLEQRNKETEEYINNTLDECHQIEKKTASEALSAIRKKESLSERHKIQSNKRTSELRALELDLAHELTNVRGRVDSILSRKEEKAAELADNLSSITKLNDERSDLLNRLRLGRFRTS